MTLEYLTEALRADEIDRLARLPKKAIYRASYEAFGAELPRLATPFLDCLELAEPVSTSGRALVDCVRDQKSNIERVTAYDFVGLFVSQYLKPLYQDDVPVGLFRDTMIERRISQRYDAIWAQGGLKTRQRAMVAQISRRPSAYRRRRSWSNVLHSGQESAYAGD